MCEELNMLKRMTTETKWHQTDTAVSHTTRHLIHSASVHRSNTTEEKKSALPALIKQATSLK